MLRITKSWAFGWLQWAARPQATLLLAAQRLDDSTARQEQAALRRVATMVAQGDEPIDIFKAVAAEVACLLGSDFTLLGRYESDETFTYLAAGGHPATSRLGKRVPLGGDNLGSRILRSGRSESMTYEDATGPIAAVAREIGVCNAVGTPILVDGEIWGAMVAGWTKRHHISPHTISRTEEITDLIATAIANTESRTALIQSRARVSAAADETRRRIERDLHDGAQQRLVNLALWLRLNQKEVPPEAAQLLADVASGLDEIIKDLREMAQGIHPAALSAGGLAPALKRLARRALLPVRINVRVDDRPPERIEAAVYYVVAEALTNIAKHAQASAAVIDVQSTARVIRATVSDDGIGGADPSRGSGLRGLRDRIDTLGGTMRLTSTPSGTSIFFEIPIPPDQRA